MPPLRHRGVDGGQSPLRAPRACSIVAAVSSGTPWGPVAQLDRALPSEGCCQGCSCRLQAKIAKAKQDFSSHTTSRRGSKILPLSHAYAAGGRSEERRGGKE